MQLAQQLCRHGNNRRSVPCSQHTAQTEEIQGDAIRNVKEESRRIEQEAFLEQTIYTKMLRNRVGVQLCSPWSMVDLWLCSGSQRSLHVAMKVQIATKVARHQWRGHIPPRHLLVIVMFVSRD